jgi:hypothetical protein
MRWKPFCRSPCWRQWFGIHQLASEGLVRSQRDPRRHPRRSSCAQPPSAEISGSIASSSWCYLFRKLCPFLCVNSRVQSNQPVLAQNRGSPGCRGNRFNETYGAGDGNRPKTNFTKSRWFCTPCVHRPPKNYVLRPRFWTTFGLRLGPSARQRSGPGRLEIHEPLSDCLQGINSARQKDGGQACATVHRGNGRSLFTARLACDLRPIRPKRAGYRPTQ